MYKNLEVKWIYKQIYCNVILMVHTKWWRRLILSQLERLTQRNITVKRKWNWTHFLEIDMNFMANHNQEAWKELFFVFTTEENGVLCFQRLMLQKPIIFTIIFNKFTLVNRFPHDVTTDISNFCLLFSRYSSVYFHKTV